MIPTKKQEMDNFVRDVTQVMPLSKSEVRRRLGELISNAVAEKEREIVKAIEKEIGSARSWGNEPLLYLPKIKEIIISNTNDYLTYI